MNPVALDLAGQVARIATMCACLLFVVVYSIMARWHRSQEGVNMVLGAVWLGVLAAIGFGRVAGLHPATVAWLTLLAWTGIAATFVWRTGLVLRAQGFLGNNRRPNRYDKGPAGQG